MVGPGAFYFALAVLDPAPEIAAAYDDPDLNAGVYACFYRFANVPDDAKVKSCVFFSRKRFSADFEQYSLIYGLHL